MSVALCPWQIQCFLPTAGLPTLLSNTIGWAGGFLTLSAFMQSWLEHLSVDSLSTEGMQNVAACGGLLTCFLIVWPNLTCALHSKWF